MALRRQLRPPADTNLLHRRKASVTREVAGLLVVELALGVPAVSSCFLLLPQCPLEQSGMLLVSQGLSTAPLLLQGVAPPPGLQALIVGVTRGSIWETTWFLLLTSRTAPASSHKKPAGEVEAAWQWGDRGNMEDGGEDIKVMRGGQEEEEEEEEGIVG